LITADELTTLLSRATSDIEPAPLAVEELIGSGLRARRRRTRYAAGTAAAVVLAGVLAVTTPWSDNPAPAPVTGHTCATTIPSRVLPAWARTGFSAPRPAMPYVLGREHLLAALLFVQPLTAPAPENGPSNKILWVANPHRVPSGQGFGSDLVIHARLADGSSSVVRTVTGGPGPSIIDLPAAGCWRLDLSWGSLTDSMDLYYAAG
jgi:hypothetical protein